MIGSYGELDNKQQVVALIDEVNINRHLSPVKVKSWFKCHDSIDYLYTIHPHYCKFSIVIYSTGIIYYLIILWQQQIVSGIPFVYKGWMACFTHYNKLQEYPRTLYLQQCYMVFSSPSDRLPSISPFVSSHFKPLKQSEPNFLCNGQ